MNKSILTAHILNCLMWGIHINCFIRIATDGLAAASVFLYGVLVGLMSLSFYNRGGKQEVVARG